MLLREIKMRSENAILEYDWKRDLAQEEDENYLPSGYDYDKVLELKIVRVLGLEKQGKGYGAELINRFLNSAVANEAELIFLDLSPHEGENKPQSDAEENHVLDKLEAAYKQLGFRNRNKHSRMWMVNKGNIPDTELPT